MGNDAWNIKNLADDKPDSFTRHSFPDGSLTPQRALLHETIIQAVTERRIDTNPKLPYKKQLRDTIDSLRNSDDYKALEARGSFSRLEISVLLDKIELKRLPAIDIAQHKTMMVTGGPATGKTNLLERVRSLDSQAYDNAIKVNPDDYKELFAPPKEFGKSYANVGHREGSILVDSIKDRISEMMKSGRAPHVVMDVVAAKKHMDIANQSSELVVITGTLDPEIAVDRSYRRGLPKIGPDGQEIIGRQTPTFIVLEGAQKVSTTTPDVLNHPNIKMGIYDTNVPQGTPPNLVAIWDPEKRTLNVTDPNKFIDFVERQNLNINATAPDEIYNPAHRTSTQLSENMKTYTDQGINVDFFTPDGDVAMSFTPEGVDVNKPVVSDRGNDFYTSLAESSCVKIKSVESSIDTDAKKDRDAHLSELQTNDPAAFKAISAIREELLTLSESNITDPTTRLNLSNAITDRLLDYHATGKPVKDIIGPMRQGIQPGAEPGSSPGKGQGTSSGGEGLGR